MRQLTFAALSDSVREERVEAVRCFGFTDRQARFLVHVLVHSGVFLERQYRIFAGIAHGQKTHDFLRKLVGRGYATAITPGALHRGRLFHVQYKPLYEAIGEPNNRNRKPASLGRYVERLMLLHAVLADRSYTWLATEQDKLRYFILLAVKDRMHKDEYPHLTFGQGDEQTSGTSPTSCRSVCRGAIGGMYSSTWSRASPQPTSASSSTDTRSCSDR